MASEDPRAICSVNKTHALFFAVYLKGPSGPRKDRTLDAISNGNFDLGVGPLGLLPASLGESLHLWGLSFSVCSAMYTYIHVYICL